jgi:hypothetical protein
MDDEVDNMLKQEAKKSNEPFKKVIGYLNIQKKTLYVCYSSMYCNFAGTGKKMQTYQKHVSAGPSQDRARR